MDDHIICAVPGGFPLTHVSAHGYIQQDGPILDRPGSRRHQVLHDRPPINIPHEPPAALRFAIASNPGPAALPRKVVADGPLRHIRDARAADQMLLRILCVVESPVQTRVVLAIAVPALGDVDLAFMGPHERLARQQPERRPYALGTGEAEPSCQTAVAAAESGPAHEPRRRVPRVRVWVVRLRDCAENQLAVVRVEAV